MKSSLLSRQPQSIGIRLLSGVAHFCLHQAVNLTNCAVASVACCSLSLRSAASIHSIVDIYSHFVSLPTFRSKQPLPSSQYSPTHCPTTRYSSCTRVHTALLKHATKEAQSLCGGPSSILDCSQQQTCSYWRVSSRLRYECTSLRTAVQSIAVHLLRNSIQWIQTNPMYTSARLYNLLGRLRIVMLSFAMITAIQKLLQTLTVLARSPAMTLILHLGRQGKVM